MNKHFLTASLLAVILLAGCKKDPVPTPVDPTPSAAPIYLLSEGSWGGNDAEIRRRTDGTLAVYEIKKNIAI